MIKCSRKAHYLNTISFRPRPTTLIFSQLLVKINTMRRKGGCWYFPRSISVWWMSVFRKQFFTRNVRVLVVLYLSRDLLHVFFCLHNSSNDSILIFPYKVLRRYRYDGFHWKYRGESSKSYRRVRLWRTAIIIILYNIRGGHKSVYGVHINFKHACTFSSYYTSSSNAL